MINLGDRLHAATEEGIVAGADEIDAGGGQTQAQFNASVGSSIGETADSSVSSTIFGWLKSIRDFLVGIVTTNPYAKESTLGSSSDSSSSNTIFGKLAAILAAFNNINIDTTALAQRSDVKDGNDTAIGMLKWLNQFFGITGSTSYTPLTGAECIAIKRYDQVLVYGASAIIPSCKPTGVTEQDVEDAAERLGITYYEPTNA